MSGHATATQPLVTQDWHHTFWVYPLLVTVSGHATATQSLVILQWHHSFWMYSTLGYSEWPRYSCTVTCHSGLAPHVLSVSTLGYNEWPRYSYTVTCNSAMPPHILSELHSCLEWVATLQLHSHLSLCTDITYSEWTALLFTVSGHATAIQSLVTLNWHHTFWVNYTLV